MAEGELGGNAEVLGDVADGAGDWGEDQNSAKQVVLGAREFVQGCDEEPGNSAGEGFEDAGRGVCGKNQRDEQREDDCRRAGRCSGGFVFGQGRIQLASPSGFEAQPGLKPGRRTAGRGG